MTLNMLGESSIISSPMHAYIQKCIHMCIPVIHEYLWQYAAVAGSLLNISVCMQYEDYYKY